jgi:hypothetical protein
MPTPSFRRTAAVLLLLLASVLAAPPASAAGRPAEAVSLSPFDLLDRIWSFLRAAWSPGTSSPPIAETKEGCHVDPSGLCQPGTPSPPPAETKEGCGIDPDGLCQP